MRVLGKVLLAVAAAANVFAQVTETVTPNAEEFAQIKSDIASYASALQTESLYQAAQSYVQAHSTSVPFVSVVLYTQSWSEGVESLNSLITTEYPSSYPTIVAELYQSILEEQANIINADITHSTTITAPLVTGTGSSSPSGNASTTYTMQTATTGTTSVTVAPSSAANANVVVSGLLLALGLGVAAVV